jgi:Uma2 family endonuclease
MGRKFQFYQRYGVEEYYIYDPNDGFLQGWQRLGDHLEEIPQMAGFVSPRLRVRFDPGDGPQNLRIFDPNGKPFLTFADWVDKSRTQQQRADEASRRAEHLAARLREQGINSE